MFHDFRLSPWNYFFFCFGFFFTVCKVREPLWVLSSLVILTPDSQDGTHSGFRNVIGKFTLRTVQKPKTKGKNQILSEDTCSLNFYVAF
jgi:hypothetical protein